MHDISTTADIKVLVDEFYKKVIADPTIGFIFTEVVQLSWQKHIPVMYSFWGSLLLGENTYKGNPMIKHMELDKLVTLTPAHFHAWLQLWVSTVNENFKGPKADEAIDRARSIAGIMLLKVEQSRPA
ncbi:MAG TPA: group III truncated hemoglobin [Chitinophagales bacterium]|nr:group III truncated hemoglobin [Chitinophagales bacterium]